MVLAIVLIISVFPVYFGESAIILIVLAIKVAICWDVKVPSATFSIFELLALANTPQVFSNHTLGSVPLEFKIIAFTLGLGFAFISSEANSSANSVDFRLLSKDTNTTALPAKDLSLAELFPFFIQSLSLCFCKGVPATELLCPVKIWMGDTTAERSKSSLNSWKVIGLSK